MRSTRPPRRWHALERQQSPWRPSRRPCRRRGQLSSSTAARKDKPPPRSPEFDASRCEGTSAPTDASGASPCARGYRHVSMSSLGHLENIGTAVLRLDNVSFVRDERVILSPLTWKVLDGQRWVILGANGSGKTTLLRIAAMYEHPSSGDVRVLGERLGRTDVRAPPPHRLYVSSARCTVPR